MIVSLWEDVVQDEDLIRALAQVHQDFHLINKTQFFWYPRPYELASPLVPLPVPLQAPRNPIERLAEIVIGIVRPRKLAGVEYWSNSLAQGSAMPLHHDKDEKLYWTENKLSHPAVSTVYYPPFPEFTGGQLVVNSEHLLNPGGNQLAAFNGALAHGVQSVKTGTRHSIALNLWEITPMTYRR